MKIDAAIAARQWEQAAVEQLARDMERDGFTVERDVAIQDVRVDLLVSRGEERILFEVKAPGAADPSAWTQSVVRMQALAKQIGARFRLVVVRVPHETSIHIGGLESALEAYLAAHPPETILAISRDAIVLDVDGIQLTSLSYEDGFDLAGSGDVLLSLPSRGMDVNLPFTFEGAFAGKSEGIDSSLQVTTLKTFTIDASMVN